MAKQNRNQEEREGQVQHAPSMHGEKTLSKLAENTNTPADERQLPGPGHDENEVRKHNTKGRDRLFEDREQHDEADKNSEKTRLARDIDRHGHGGNDELSHRDNQSRAKRKS